MDCWQRGVVWESPGLKCLEILWMIYRQSSQFSSSLALGKLLLLKTDNVSWQILCIFLPKWRLLCLLPIKCFLQHTVQNVYQQLAVYCVGCSLLGVLWYECMNRKIFLSFPKYIKMLSHLEFNVNKDFH